MRKFSINSDCLPISGPCGFDGAVKASDVYVADRPFLSSANLRSPFIPVSVHSYVARFVIFVLLAISSILRVCGKAKIAFAVIQRVAVNGVDNAIIWCAQNESRQTLTSTIGVVGLFGPSPMGSPVEFHDSVKIFRINDGVQALSERNKANGCIGWLNYFMTRNAVCSHGVYDTRKGAMIYA